MTAAEMVNWESRERYFGLINYRPHAGQVLFHKSKARILVLCAGTRFGKSLSGGRHVEPILLLPNTRVWIVAPTYALGEKEFRYIYDDMVVRLKLPIRSCHYDVRGGNMDIKFEWGAELVVKSCDNPDGLLGEEVDAMILSEGAKIGRRVWERYLVGRLTSRKGICIIPTTPAGFDDFLYPLFLKGQDKSQSDIESWQFPSEYNPYIDKAEIARAKELLGEETFNEQYGGQFVTLTGRVYKDFNVNVHVIQPFDVPFSWDRARAIDYGVTNPFVCLWFAVSPDGTVFVTDEHYMPGKPISYHAEVIKSKSGVDFRGATYIDPSAGIKLDLSTLGIPCIDADNDKTPGISRVQEYLKVDSLTKRPKLMIFSKCLNVINEMTQYVYGEPKHGLNVKEDPLKKSDHAMDALRYFLMTRPSFVGGNVPKADNWGTIDWVLAGIQNRENYKGFIGNEYAEVN